MKKGRLTVEVIMTLSALLGVIIDMSGQRSFVSALKLLNYFTIQSNLLVFIVMLLVVVNRMTKSEQPMWLTFLTGGAVLWIMATGLIFHFMLAGIYVPTGIQRYSNIMLHYLTPTLMTVYYIVYVNKKVIRMIYPIYWASYPMIYGIVSLIRGQIDGFYPYWFLKPYGSFPKGNGSYSNVILFVVVMSVGFITFGYIILIIKKLMPLLENKKSSISTQV